MINTKGQGSVELLIGLGVILIILLGFITLAQEGLRQAQIQKDIGIAERTVNEVSEAVETVCHQGIGARKQVFINIPDSTNLNESYIGKPSGSSAPSKMISLNLRGTDIFRTVGCEVKGNWPDRTGNDWINIESKGDYVLVGQGLIDVDKNSVYFLIPQNTTRNDTIKVTNIYDDEVNVTITKYWVHSIGLAISPMSFSFDPDDEQNVNVQISASNESSGIYSGYILFNATSGNKTEEIKTYITVEIRVSGGGGNATTYPSLRVIPNEWNETMNQSEHKEKEFIICTNSNSSFNTLSFTPSSGNPGNWVGNTGSIGPIGTDDCKTKTLWLDIPANQSGGDYSGYINVTGSGGSPTYTTNITLNVHVNDVTPPNITFVPPTDCNVTITTQNWTFINVSLSENPDWIRLEWNGTNETMNGGGTNWYKNMTNLANGNYTFKVYANDSSGNMGVSQTCWVNVHVSFFKIEWGSLVTGSSWSTVNLNNNYTEPVIVVSVNYKNNTLPIVPRITDATSNSFKVKLQNPSGSSILPDKVYYLVVEQGNWTLQNGKKIEAYKYNTSTVDYKNHWVGDTRSYVNTYSYPVVVASVMSYNDPDWQAVVTWGSSRTNPPNPTNLVISRHVGEDTDHTRADETIGYIVFEKAHDTINGIDYEAKVGSDTVRGVANSPPYYYTFDSSFSSIPQVGIVTLAGLDGGDGGWAQLHGNAPLSQTQIGLSVDEDQVGDSDRSHATEQVGYVVFEQNGGYDSSDTTPPNITFVSPTDCNVTITDRDWTFVNTTMNENSINAVLEWNGTNETMNGGGTNWYKNKTSVPIGNYTFKVWATDKNNNAGYSETCWINFDYCLCSDWVNDSCGGTCSPDYMHQVRTCNPSGCAIEERCASDSCSDWENDTCGGDGCSSSQMHQTRTCTFGCLDTDRCVDDSCTAWTNQGCGGDGCGTDYMYRTRSCTYGCMEETNCDYDDCSAWESWYCTGNQGESCRDRTCEYNCRSTHECQTCNNNCCNEWCMNQGANSGRCIGNSCRCRIIPPIFISLFINLDENVNNVIYDKMDYESNNTLCNQSVDINSTKVNDAIGKGIRYMMNTSSFAKGNWSDDYNWLLMMKWIGENVKDPVMKKEVNKKYEEMIKIYSERLKTENPDLYDKIVPLLAQLDERFNPELKDSEYYLNIRNLKKIDEEDLEIENHKLSIITLRCNETFNRYNPIIKNKILKYLKEKAVNPKMLKHPHYYRMTHALYYLDEMEKEGCVHNSKKSIEHVQNAVYKYNALCKEFNDWNVEGATLLLLTNSSKFNPGWINIILNNQNEDGGWPIIEGSDVSHPHTTGLSILTLILYEQNLQKGEVYETT